MSYIVECTITDSHSKKENKSHVAYVQRTPGQFGHRAFAAHYNEKRANEIATAHTSPENHNGFSFECRAVKVD